MIPILKKTSGTEPGFTSLKVRRSSGFQLLSITTLFGCGGTQPLVCTTFTYHTAAWSR